MLGGRNKSTKTITCGDMMNKSKAEQQLDQWRATERDWERGHNTNLPGYDQWWIDRAERSSRVSRDNSDGYVGYTGLSLQEIIQYLESDNEQKWDIAVSALLHDDKVAILPVIPHLVSLLNKLADKKASQVIYNLENRVMDILDENKSILSADVMLPILLKIAKKSQ